MSVLLVNPPPLERVPARIATPPMGLLYLAASLVAQGIETQVLDADAQGLSLQQTVARARELAPQIIGVTAMTPTAEAAYAALAGLRSDAACLVLGGAHASALGAGVHEHCPVELDAVFCGEAEQTFTEFARRVLAGESATDLELAGMPRPGDATDERDWPKINDLDGLPFPDRASGPWKNYRHPLLAGGPVTSIITSRGCPYRCVFCDKSVCGRKWRARSADNVLAEIEDLVLKTGVRRLIIYDDLFTLDRKRVIEICSGIIDRGLDLRWKCEGRVDRVDEESLSWMKRAGCEMVAYGVESATDQGRAFLQKDVSVDQVREAFAMTKKAGLKTLGYYLLGVPGETMEDEMETARLAVETGADYAQFGLLSPFPGTSLHEWANERGYVHEVEARGPAERGNRRAVVLDDYWTLERLDEIVRRAHRVFYGRPGYVLKRLTNVSSPAELFEGAAQAARLAKWWFSGRGS